MVNDISPEPVEEKQFHHNKVLRRQEREKKKKEKRIKWLQKIYSGGLLGSVEKFNADESNVPEIEAEELLKWSNNLDFESYVETWGSNATSHSS